MNVINSIALGEYEKLGVRDMTLSVEINSGELLWFGNNVKIGIVSYGFLPLMQLRNCPLKAHVGCEKCGGNGTVKDRMNNDFPLLCHGKYVSLLNTVPVSVSDKKLCVDFQTLYFTTETSSRVAHVLDAFVNGKEPTYPHTKGLYFRKVL
jgi:putative protease